MKFSLRRSTKCPNCQAKLAAGSPFCSHCGAHTLADGDPATSKSASKTARIAAIAMCVLLVGGAVVGIGAKIRHDRAEEKQQAQRLEAKKKAAAKLRAEQAEYQQCVAEQSGLIDQLEEIDARLNVGMKYSEYSDMVSDLSVEYSKSETSDLELDCLGLVAVPTEAAVRQYVRAAREWNDCIEDYDCDTEELDLQAYWTRASDKATSATDALASLEP